MTTIELIILKNQKTIMNTLEGLLADPDKKEDLRDAIKETQIAIDSELNTKRGVYNIGYKAGYSAGKQELFDDVMSRLKKIKSDILGGASL